MTAARRGTARVVHLVGEPGIGKTTLAERAAALASEQGWVAAWGRAWDAGAAPPYWLWQQVLGSLARTTNLSGRVHPATAAWLADLVPELAGAGEVPPAPALDPDRARLALQRAVVHVLATAGAGHPGVPQPARQSTAGADDPTAGRAGKRGDHHGTARPAQPSGGLGPGRSAGPGGGRGAGHGAGRDPAGGRRGGLAAPGKRRQPVLRRPTGALVGHARAGRAARRAAGERGGASGGRRAAGRAWWRGPPGGDGGGGGRRRGRPRGPCHRGWAAAGPLRRRGHRRGRRGNPVAPVLRAPVLRVRARAAAGSRPRGGRRRRAAGAAPGDRGRAGGAARPARAAG